MRRPHSRLRHIEVMTPAVSARESVGGQTLEIPLVIHATAEASSLGDTGRWHVSFGDLHARAAEAIRARLESRDVAGTPVEIGEAIDQSRPHLVALSTAGGPHE